MYITSRSHSLSTKRAINSVDCVWKMGYFSISKEWCLYVLKVSLFDFSLMWVLCNKFQYYSFSSRFYKVIIWESITIIQNDVYKNINYCIVSNNITLNFSFNSFFSLLFRYLCNDPIWCPRPPSRAGESLQVNSTHHVCLYVPHVNEN